MPTYDYVCESCDHEFEMFQRITEDPISKCPECKRNRLRRLFGTGAAVVFKGSGFYQTDYRSDSYKKAADAEKKSSETKSDGGDGKKTSKSDSGKSTKSDTTTSTSSDSTGKSSNSKVE